MDAKVNILLVDDHQDNLLALTAVLSCSDYNLICLQSGEDLLRYVLKEDTHNIAIILLDVQMPGLNGIETAKLIKEREKTKDIPIIFITAISKSEEHVLQGYQSGSVDYIFKPFHPELLRLKVQAFVHLHQEKAKIKTGYKLLDSMVKERTQKLETAYEELKKSEDRFKKIFLLSPNLKAIRQLHNLQYIDVNESWIMYTGYSYQEAVGQAGDLIRTVSDSIMDEGIQVGEIYRNHKIRYITKTGEIRIGLLSTEIIELNEQKCILEVITDITEKVAWEKEMERLARLNIVGEMAAGFAHEIRNPMTTIRGFLQMAKNSRDIVPEYIDIMLEELGRANNIITEYLSLAKNKATHMQMSELNRIIDTLYPLIQAEAMLANKQIHLELGPLPAIMLDEKEIRQLILNISINGLEAMEDGGTLKIATYVEEDHVILHIEDQGIGIREEHLEKLGTPFFTTKDQGTGLGLAICYSIAARHGATIEVRNGSQGVTFLVRFKTEMSRVS